MFNVYLTTLSASMFRFSLMASKEKNGEYPNSKGCGKTNGSSPVAVRPKMSKLPEGNKKNPRKIQTL